jgi:hypothetical protein
MDLDELIATAAPRTKTVQVCGRGDLAAEHERLATRLQGLMLDPNKGLAGNPEVHEVAQQIADLEDAMAASTIDVTVKALSRNAWADLLAAHPPSREQSRAGEDVNPKTFPVAAVAACSHEPQISATQAEALAGKLPVGEWQKLWMAVASLNTVPTTVPKLRAATELLAASEPSSTTSVPVESLGVPSLGGSGEASRPTTTTTTAA